ncbi:MAG: winged helix-turn-helix transcriptional regulator, partial [Planctomycetes bacterium]|nr:winged helix-turn-helix transcriptional regulator [Planctomycetota bacterium]
MKPKLEFPIPRYREIANDLCQRIGGGEMAPGDRLPAIKGLCSHYGAGQATVEKAIKRLEDQGLIEVRRRSGVYIKEALPPTPCADPPTVDAPKMAKELPTMLDFLVSRSAPRRELTLYVSSLEPKHLQLWQDLLEEFSPVPARVLSCVDGHAEELFRRSTLDLIQTTPFVLKGLGPQHFIPYPSLREGLDKDWEAGLLPLVRERLHRGKDPLGVPFSVTLSYRLVN